MLVIVPTSDDLNTKSGVWSFVIPISVTVLNVGAILSIKNCDTYNVFDMFPALSSIDIVIFCTPFCKFKNLIVLLPTTALDVGLSVVVNSTLQFIVPCSVVLNTYSGINTFVGVATGITSDNTGAVVSITKSLIDIEFWLPAISTTVIDLLLYVPSGSVLNSITISVFSDNIVDVKLLLEPFIFDTFW